MSDQRKEFTVEVPDRGYIDSFTGMISDNTEKISTVETETDGLTFLESAKQQYRKMGCPEVADTLRLVSRTVEVVRSEWEPVT